MEKELNRPLKYLSYGIVCQEVPEEVSLVINISGCPYKCKGCHSDYLWEYKGNYISNDIDKIINEYKDLFSCICFMGGNQNPNEMIKLLSHIKLLGYKTCLYSGCNNFNELKVFLPYLDWLKYGSYDETKKANNIQYGVKLATTNQHLLKKDIDF